MNCRSEEKVLCPWCGAEMRETIYNDSVWIETKRTVHEAYHAFCKCRSCGAQGPVEYRKVGNAAAEAARAAALRRYTPMLQPMTWDEFVRMTHPRLDGTEYPPVFVETAKAYSGRCGSWIIAKPNAIRVDTRYKPNRAFVDAHCVNLDAMAYGKTWRCWERKPTDEERGAAGWSKH